MHLDELTLYPADADMLRRTKQYDATWVLGGHSRRLSIAFNTPCMYRRTARRQHM